MLYKNNKFSKAETLKLINAKGWVPQKRIRAFMLFFRRDSFTPDYVFNCQSHLDKLAARGTENEVPFSKIREKNPSKEEYQIPEGTWKSLQRHKERHSKEKRGFGYGIVDDAKATRTLSARYHKDGAEILIKEPYYLDIKFQQNLKLLII